MSTPASGWHDNELFRALVEGVQDYAIFMLDAQGRVASWNAGAERIKGYTAGEIIGRHFSCFYPAVVAAAGVPQEELRIAGAAGRFEDSALRVRGDGTQFWANVVITAIRDAAGELRGFSKITRDITEKVNADTALRNSQDRYRQLFDRGTDGIFVVQDRRVVLFNPAARRIAGREPPPEGVLAVVHADDRDAVRERMLRGEREEHLEQRYQCRILRPDGATVWVDVSSAGIEWEGRPARLSFMSDITARRAAEEQLREAVKHEAIGQLTGGLAHDFNNLLGIIVGNLDEIGAALPDGPQGAGMRQRHRVALDAALRGAEVTRALLAVARRQALQIAPYDINLLVTRMLPLLRSSLGSGVALQSDLAGGVLMARLDASGLSNVVLNLVINSRDALKGTAGTHVVLRTRREFVPPGAWFAVLEVSDEGRGMSEAVRTRAFDPFYTTKAPGEGTGLGLSMVKGYAEQIGGAATIRSAEGRGTTVSIFLPLEPGYAPAAGAAAPLPAAATGGRSTRPRVLVVDDIADICELSLIWLEGAGYEATAALSSAAALELLAAQPFDLLITDVTMPGGMDGLQLATQARARQPGLRVVVASGYAEKLLGQRDLPGPLLAKPFRKSDLLRAAAQALAAPSS